MRVLKVKWRIVGNDSSSPYLVARLVFGDRNFGNCEMWNWDDTSVHTGGHFCRSLNLEEFVESLLRKRRLSVMMTNMKKAKSADLRDLDAALL